MKNVNPFFNEPAFTLSYQTRDQSEEFLKTLDMTKQDDNIDFWFIAKAYNTIKSGLSRTYKFGLCISLNT